MERELSKHFWNPYSIRKLSMHEAMTVIYHGRLEVAQTGNQQLSEEIERCVESLLGTKQVAFIAGLK